MKTLRLLIVLMLLPASAWAQVSVVQKALDDLRAANVSLDGPCGGFRVIELAAWRLRSSGAGYYKKGTNGGTNCLGYSIDIIAFQNGQAFDVLIDADGDGASKQATWNPLAPFTDPNRFQAAIDPGEPGVPGGGGETPQPAGLTRLDVRAEIRAAFADYTAVRMGDEPSPDERRYLSLAEQLGIVQRKQDDLAEALDAHDKKVNALVGFLKKPETLTAIITAVTTWFTLGRNK